ncbi:type VI secretion protein [Streptomyces sp. E11-3]|uniref:type VI secretion protein n=1 Tax=Streptomyces sp. E11-3 TaxID=3110112 RepID=UPI00397F4D6C
MRESYEPRHSPERGVPDGLLIGVLAFIVGLTVLAWSSTGLAGLFAHGSWPQGVTFSHTAVAVRHLVSEPHDVAGAWPSTPAEQLSGYGLFWGLFIGQVLILIVLTIFVMGTVTRWRAQRARRRAAGRPGNAGSATAAEADRAPGGRGRDAAGGPAAQGDPRFAPGGAERDAAQGGAGTGYADRPAAAEPAAASSAQGIPSHPTLPNTEQRVSGWETHHGEAASPPTAGEPDTSPPPRATAPTAEPSPAVPSPRTPLVLGGAETRRPAAVQAVRDAEGAALVVTSDPTVWEETKDARAKLGPVLLYDPSHLCDTPARMHWNPGAGCQDKETARSRAQALLAPVRPTAKLDAAVANTAETLLRSYLHAAAVDGREFKHVHRWCQGTQVQDAVRILRTHPKAASGAAGELESELTAHTERRDMAQELTARALSALFSIHIREACTPNRTDALTLDSFVDEGGTLYVVGEAIEDPKSGPGAMPLLTALTSNVVEHGRRMAAGSSSGRLDPPLTLVLDDIAAVAPLPQLPALLATGADQGLPTLALLRSREQGRSRWPEFLSG